MVFGASEYKAQHNFSQWKSMRRKTTIAMLIVNLIGGIDISIMLTTLIPYLKYTIKVKNVNLFYALTTTAFCIGSALFGMAAGKIVDRTRLIKIFTIITLLLQIVGNLIYVIPLTPFFALFGRLIAGAGESFASVCIGEVIRIYDTEGSNRVICWLATMCSFGFVIGSILTLPLSSCHFNLGKLHIDGYNAAGLFMASICTLALFLCLFTVHDCSKVFDMKAYLVQSQLEKEPDDIEDEDFSNGGLQMEERSDDQKSLKESKASKGLNPFYFVKSFDQWMVLIFSFVTMFIIASGENLFPLINYEILGWSLHALVVIFGCFGFSLLAISIILSRLCVDDKSVYLIGYASLPSVSIFYVVLLLISLTERNKVFDTVCMAFMVLSLVFVWFLEMVAFRSMFGRMVTSDIQSFAEAFRTGVSRMGLIIAAFVTPFLVSVLTWYSIVFIVVGVLMFSLYTARRKSLIAIKVAGT